MQVRVTKYEVFVRLVCNILPDFIKLATLASGVALPIGSRKRQNTVPPLPLWYLASHTRPGDLDPCVIAVWRTLGPPPIERILPVQTRLSPDIVERLKPVHNDVCESDLALSP